MRKALILAFTFVFFLGLLVGYIPILASPGPGAPNPGHTASSIGGDTDAERTFASSGKYTFLGNLDIRGGLIVNNNVGIGATDPKAKLHVSGGDIYVDSGKALRSYTGDLIIDAHSTGSGTVYMYDNVNIASNLDVRGFTLHHHGGDLLITCDGCGRGDGGRALVHDVGDTLAINYAGDFSGGTRVDGPLMGGKGSLIANFLDVGDVDHYPRYVFCMEKPVGIDWSDYKPCGGNQYWWTVTIYGYIYAPSDGTYNFWLTVDDGASLHIDGGSPVIADWNEGGSRERSGNKWLSQGWHTILIQHFQESGPERLKVEWQPPGQSRRLFSSSDLAYPPIYGFGLIAGIFDI